MTPNKVQHFQEWLEGFKKKPVIIRRSQLPSVEDYQNNVILTDLMTELGLSEDERKAFVLEVVAPGCEKVLNSNNCKKFGISMDNFNPIAMGSAGIFGAEAGEKLRRSILKLQNAQTKQP